jgi:hypothetical protein
LSSGSTVSAIDRDVGVRAVFRPEQIAEVKAIACALPRSQGVPLSRFSRAELHRRCSAERVRGVSLHDRPWNEIAEPFDWRFTRDDLAALITRLAAHEPQLQLAA